MSTLKPHKELLLDIIFAENKENIPYADLIVGEARVNDDPEKPGDTAVTIYSNNPKKYYGDVVATFDKLDLEAVFASIGLDTLHLITSATTVHGLIPALQTTYNMNVYESDLVDTPFTFENGEAVIALEAAPGSMFYKGQILAEVTRPVAIPLSELIRVQSLSGLNYPKDTDAPLISREFTSVQATGFEPA